MHLINYIKLFLYFIFIMQQEIETILEIYPNSVDVCSIINIYLKSMYEYEESLLCYDYNSYEDFGEHWDLDEDFCWSDYFADF